MRELDRDELNRHLRLLWTEVTKPIDWLLERPKLAVAVVSILGLVVVAIMLFATPEDGESIWQFLTSRFV